MNYGKLYLIPNFLSNETNNDFLPEMVKRMSHDIKNLVVESEKEARALVKKLQLATPQNELQLFVLNEHTEAKTYHHLLKALENGQDAGIISDAGLPCVADPGFQLVALAHQKNIAVIPLPGASSIFMALMASGFSGQNFAFTGYIPIDKAQRVSFAGLSLKGMIRGQYRYLDASELRILKKLVALDVKEKRTHE